MGNPALRTRIVLAFAAVYLIWGSTYLAIRFGVATLPPFLMAGTRFLVAGAALYAFSRLRGAPRPGPVAWRDATIVGALMLLGGNGLVTWSELRVPSGIAALVVACVPLFVVILSRRRPTPREAIGIASGLAGVALLVGPSGRVDPWGAGALVFASLSWAAGSLFSRRAALPGSALQAVGMEMLGGGTLLALLGVAMGEAGRLSLDAVSPRSWASLAYLIVFGSIVGFTSYMWLLGEVAPSKAATYAFVNPLVAVVLGWSFAGETLGPRELLAAAVIVAAVAMIVGAPAAGSLKPPRSIRGASGTASSTPGAPATRAP